MLNGKPLSFDYTLKNKTPACITDDSRGTDYCQMETFKANCAENEIIMMKSARYGRMRLGRCLTRNYYVGCSADVLPHLDTLCSGSLCWFNIEGHCSDLHRRNDMKMS